MSYTLAEAAAACGIDKSTVRRAVRSGRISGTRNDLGVWHVEAAELHRVFPPVQSPTAVTGAMPRDAVTAAPDRTNDPATDVLVRELRLLLEQARTDATTWRQAWETQIAQQRQLAAPQPKGWWRWLRTTG
jgi:Helix-turn-helix domain